MDDFLHNLRSGKLKHQDRGRRDYSDYKGPQRRGGNERRHPDYYTKVTNENFALVKDSISQLTAAQKRIGEELSAVEKTGTRIADALEKIVDIMNDKLGHEEIQIPGTDPDDALSTSTAITTAVKETRPTKTKLSNEDKPRMLNVIASMRKEKKSWDKIADHMGDLNIPTVSGKGKWRGQAIKKFYDANS